MLKTRIRRNGFRCAWRLWSRLRIAARLAEQHRQQYKPNVMPDPGPEKRLMTQAYAHVSMIVVAPDLV